MSERTMRVKRFLLLGIAVVSMTAAPALADEPGATRPPPPLSGGLGSHRHPVTVSSPEAQQYFDQGLLFQFGFNQGAASRSFLHAARLDDGCALCYWGVAYTLGPTINDPMSPASGALAYESLQKAVERAPNVSGAEQAYLTTLAARYASPPATDQHALDVAHANAMRDLAHRYPDDPDAAALFAEALMNTTPWHYGDDGQPGPVTNELLATLESVLARNPGHPLALHLYIHALEHSPYPEKAEAAADRLVAAAPGIGHLVHMASHIYIRLGRYRDGIAANQQAVKADEALLADEGGSGAYHRSYYPHHVDFLWQASTLGGDAKAAIDAAWKLEATVPQDKTDVPGHYRQLAAPFFTLVRFGRWDDILAEPAAEGRPAFQRALRHAARGHAFAAKGKLQAATHELRALDRLHRAELPPMQGMSADKAMMALAYFTLAGEIEGRRGRLESMRGNYLVAFALQDQLPREELRPWYPTRALYGAALLRAGRAKEAEAVFREDLALYPKNDWALSGLLRALKARGTGPEADEVEKQLQTLNVNR